MTVSDHRVGCRHLDGLRIGQSGTSTMGQAAATMIHRPEIDGLLLARPFFLGVEPLADQFDQALSFVGASFD